MKAIVVNPKKKDSVRLQEIEKPIPKDSQALLKVIEVGIDGTDIEINDGLYGEPPEGSDYLVVGHECLGVVEEIRGHSDIARGDLVVPTVRRPDDCVNCRSGESDMCLTGGYKEHGIRGLHGFAAEYGVSDSAFLVKVSDKLKRVATLVEPMSIAEKAVLQAYKIQERLLWRPKRVLVLGAGPLGLLTVFLLRLKGLDVIAVATRSKESFKAKIVERVGGAYVNAKEQPINSLGKFDLILEETGSPKVAMEAQKLLNPNGVMCFLGIYESQEARQDVGSLYTDLVLGNKVFFGSVNANKRYFEEGLKDFEEIEKRFPNALKDMITNTVSPTDYIKAFKPGPEEIKTVIDFRNVS
ncbi:MAG: glucose 1-dehydrogenase [Thaumarchaeota archaeon]|nr:glucose 1-dehydrogenase [Nitrososphaerota archaeon]